MKCKHCGGLNDDDVNPIERQAAHIGLQTASRAINQLFMEYDLRGLKAEGMIEAIAAHDRYVKGLRPESNGSQVP
jgi:hypothetical protein